MNAGETSPVLEIRDLTKSFGPVSVLKGVTFSLGPGVILGLAGENGAGKSTLAKCISSQYRPDSGTIRLNGSCFTVPQEFTLIPTLRVYENIFLGRELSRYGFLKKKAMILRAQALLNKVGCTVPPRKMVSDLNVAEKQKIEIAKAFLDRSKLLILDEPTTVLNRMETETLFQILREFREQGGSVIYISHKLEEVRTICDRIVVLRDGVLVADEASGDLSAEEIARRMVGRNLTRIFPPKRPADPGTDEVLRCENVSSGREVLDVSFSLKKGEILGLAGLAGAGRTELAETICGFRRRSGGRIVLNSSVIPRPTPDRMLRAGLSYLPEDRQRTAILPDFTLADNLTLSSLSRYTSLGFIREKRCREAAARYMERFRIRAASPDERLGNLSGGNQQKTVIARGLDSSPSVFIFDEPTRGVDVGARGEIYEFIHALAESGVSCLFISSDLEEIIGCCARVLVMREGRISGELSGDDVNEERIMFLATGVK